MSSQSRNSSPARPPLDLEQVAAYLDGRLEAKQRAALEERLAEDDEALELLAEAARVLETAPTANGELAEEHEQEKRRGFGWSGVTGWLALAAGLLVAAIVAVVQPWRDPLDRRSGEWVATLPEGTLLAERLGAGWTDAPWSEPRSSPAELGTPLYPPSVAAFRIGARTVDLAAALRAKEKDTAEVVARELLGLYESLDSNASAFGVRLVVDVLAGGQGEEATRAALEHLEIIPEPDPVEPYRLGQWAESARLAAIVEDRQYFEGRDWKGGLRRLEHPDAGPKLNRLAEQLGRADNDLTSLRGNVEQVIELLGDGLERARP